MPRHHHHHHQPAAAAATVPHRQGEESPHKSAHIVYDPLSFIALMLDWIFPSQNLLVELTTD